METYWAIPHSDVVLNIGTYYDETPIYERVLIQEKKNAPQRPFHRFLRIDVDFSKQSSDSAHKRTSSHKKYRESRTAHEARPASRIDPPAFLALDKQCLVRVPHNVEHAEVRTSEGNRATVLDCAHTRTQSAQRTHRLPPFVAPTPKVVPVLLIEMCHHRLEHSHTLARARSDVLLPLVPLQRVHKVVPISRSHIRKSPTRVVWFRNWIKRVFRVGRSALDRNRRDRLTELIRRHRKDRRHSR
jgi:hypothetical protein